MKTKYLLHFRGIGRIIEIDNAATSADDWGKLEADFATEVRNGKPPRDVWDTYAYATALHADQVTPQGIPYDYELAGPDGADYRLLCFKGETRETINEAGKWIRQQFDAVRVTALRIELRPEAPHA